jgi:ABC-type branched-subunit amino acid transport system substrate-binding protein
MRVIHKNLFLLGIAVLIISFSIFTWSSRNNIQGEATKGYVLRNFQGQPILPKEDLTVGIITPLSGPQAFIGKASFLGFEEARRELKSKGKQVNIVYKDSQCDPVIAGRRAEELMSEGVQVIIGADCYSHEPLYVEGAVISTTPTFDSKNPFAYSLESPLDDEVYALLLKILVPQTVSVIYPDNALGQDYLSALKKRVRVVSSYAYHQDQEAFGGVAEKIKNRDSEATFIVAENVAELKSALKALDEADYHNLILSNYAISDQYLKSIGTDAYLFEGLTFVSDIDPITSRKMAKDYFDAMRGQGQEPSTYDANAYDSLMLVQELSEKGSGQGATSETIAEGMHSMLNHEGVTGFMTLQKNGITRSYYVRKIVDGKVVKE